MLFFIINTGDSTNFALTILSGQVSGPPNNTTISSGVITDSNINTSVAIQNTKLATIQTVEKVLNSCYYCHFLQHQQCYCVPGFRRKMHSD